MLVERSTGGSETTRSCGRYGTGRVKKLAICNSIPLAEGFRLAMVEDLAAFFMTWRKARSLGSTGLEQRLAKG